jgi:CHAT domain-containing protein/tetratricopeptide (TPR) repeat protein
MSRRGGVVIVQIREWVARVVMSLATLTFVALAHAAQPAPSIDGIYLAIGQGDDARALESSAALLGSVGDADPRRADVLQARLDALFQLQKLDGPDRDALRASLQRFAAKHPRGDVLLSRFDLLAGLAQKHAADELAQVNALIAASTKTSDVDLAELRVIEMRIAAVVDGHLDEVRAAAQSALEVFGKQKSVRAIGEQIELRHFIGNVYYYTGSKSDALEQFQIAFDLAVATFGADSSARIKLDIDRGTALSDLARPGDALAVREASLPATQKRYGVISIQAVKAEAMIGASLQEIGDYPASSTRYKHAEEVLAQIQDPSAHEVGVIAANYGNLLQEMGDTEGSLAQYRKALAAWGDDAHAQRARAVVFANTGNTEFRMGRYDDAIADFKRALALREQTDGKNAPGLAFSLEGLGSASIALRQYAEAQKYFERALDVRGHSVAPSHPTLAVYNFGLALSHWGQGHSDEAFRYAKTTAENQQALLAAFASEFSERQSVAYRDILVPATALVVTLAAQRGDAQSIATAWHLTMVERGLVARSQAHQFAAARSAKDPKLADAWNAWRHANSVLGEAWLSTKTAPEKLEQLRAEAETAERTLWKLSGHDPGQDIDKNPAPAELAKSLPRDGLIVAFTEGVADDSALLLATGNKPLPEDWYAFTLGSDAKPALHRVGTIAALSAQVHAWYSGLRNPDSDIATLRRNGLALRHSLLDSIVSSDTKHLFVVPEGELFRVSFAALPDAKHGYLIESGMRVHTLAHESDVTLPRPIAAATTLLAGAPDFPQLAMEPASTSRQLCVRASRQGFAAIPNAAREIDDLHGLLASSSDASRVSVVEGAAATKDNVIAALPKANIIHIATHGFSLDDSCAEAANTRGVTIGDSTTAGAPNFALSGLAFSGAALADGHEPIGVLSAGELGTLDLSNAQWVALSACDSGLGPIGRNEGVFGMRRALRLAGARTVVMSLWQVDDAATAGLMESLYRARFVEHADVPDAMSAAMRSTIAARRAANLSDHPYYWAAFISEGGWR